MITIKAKGSFSKTYQFFEKCKEIVRLGDFNRYGRMGVDALVAATPKDSGITASSWGYEIKHGTNSISITWTNSNTNEGIPIAILIQYGHATKDGYFVQSNDFINPALKSVFDDIAEDMWKEVKRL